MHESPLSGGSNKGVSVSIKFRLDSKEAVFRAELDASAAQSLVVAHGDDTFMTPLKNTSDYRPVLSVFPAYPGFPTVIPS